MCTNIYIYIYTYVCVYIYIYIYIYTNQRARAALAASHCRMAVLSRTVSQRRSGRLACVALLRDATCGVVRDPGHRHAAEAARRAHMVAPGSDGVLDMRICSSVRTATFSAVHVP